MPDKEPSDLSCVPMPKDCRTWVLGADDKNEIFDQGIKVDLDWWNDALSLYGLPGGPVVGAASPADPAATTSSVRITRDDIFQLAAGADEDPETALRLLWYALAWGTGSKRRLVRRRLKAIADNRVPTTEALMDAARLASTDPVAAYERMAPKGRNVITYLGPAFFTKYLYFAGGGNPEHPCLILDSRVAESLARAGWTSMHSRGGWPSRTYQRYLVELIKPWHASLPVLHSGRRPRADLIERWLFDRR